MKRRLPSPTAAAVAGLVAVLVALTAVAILVGIRTTRAADRAATSINLSDHFAQARYDVGAEESLERKYRLEPSAEVLARWRLAAAGLVGSLDSIRAEGDEEDALLANRVLALHRVYVAGTTAMFAAVDAHRPALVLKLDAERVDPPFAAIEEIVDSAAGGERAEAAASIAGVERTSHRVLRETPVVFALGLALIALFAAVVVRSRRRAEHGLRAAEEKFRTLVESLPLVTYIARARHSLVYISPQVEAMLGVTVDDVLVGGRRVGDLLHPEDHDRVMEARTAADEPGKAISLEYRFLRPDGRVVWVQDAAVAERGRDGSVQLRGYLLDITARKEAEERLEEREQELRQSQKLEAVGRLAGGVAHDFNNLLTAIGGYCGLLRERVDDEPTTSQYVDEIALAAERAGRLTNQLLVFSRKKMLTPRVVALAPIVTDLEPMLRRLVKESISLVVECDDGRGVVEADSGLLEQVVVNLVVNAQDAIPNGGRITITADEADGADPETGEERRWARLTVADTGIGMDSETRARIFEPFFTTKEPGSGTGLGLSTVYGIVEQSSGFIAVESEPGAGSVFTVHLPLTDKVPEPAPDTQPTEAVGQGGAETVLLVEDEPAIRPLVRTMLEESGYVVLEAADGYEALAVARTHHGRIDLVLTDVVMPRLGGRELATRVTADRPGIRILFTSGYTDDVVVQQGGDSDFGFLQKPYTMAALAAKVREVLDAEPARHAAA